MVEIIKGIIFRILATTIFIQEFVPPDALYYFVLLTPKYSFV